MKRTALSSKSLNAILRIKLRNIPITEFNQKYSDNIVNYWYNQKERRINQKKRKQYEERNGSQMKKQCFVLFVLCTAGIGERRKGGLAARALPLWSVPGPGGASTRLLFVGDSMS